LLLLLSLQAHFWIRKDCRTLFQWKMSLKEGMISNGG